MSSVRVFYTDPDEIGSAVDSFAEHLKIDHPEIVSLYWFGSWVNGDFTPASDADICIVVSHSPLKPRDRIPAFMPHVFPTGLDLFIYTQEEFELLRQNHPTWYETITQGRKILSTTP